MYKIFKNITNYISGIDPVAEKVKNDKSPRKKVDYFDEEPQLPVFADHNVFPDHSVLNSHNYKEKIDSDDLVLVPEVPEVVPEVMEQVVITVPELDTSEDYHDSENNEIINNNTLNKDKSKSKAPFKTLKKLSCSPVSEKTEIKDYSCYTKKSIIKLRDMWNARHPDAKILSNDPKQIHNELYKHLQNVCDTEASTCLCCA
jgi:hypothetical protein